ncbi:MAG TPA: sarcosine oxidase subunit gamma family protein [Rhizomicrobium sp.]|jgi:sarcosine oxidase subunit gamma
MPDLQRQSALTPHQTEHHTDGLSIHESTLAVLGLRLVRGTPASVLETRLVAELPKAINTARTFGEGWIVGTEPDVWRIYTPAARHCALVRAFADLPATAGLASDLSSRFCTLEVTGPSARMALASACPLDLHPETFGTGSAASSVLLGSPVLIVKTSDAPSFLLSCERPHAAIVWDWLAAGTGHGTMPVHDAGRFS